MGPSDPYRRSEEVLQNKTASQAAREGDLATLETYKLRGEDFSKVDDQGKTPLQHAVEREQFAAFPILGVRSALKSGLRTSEWPRPVVLSKLLKKRCPAYAALKVDGSVVTWGSPAS